ncbi:MAG: flavodoxin [Candidatus Ornithomonoglobus sp.]
MKKILSILLTIMMCFCLSSVTYAATMHYENGVITVRGLGETADLIHASYENGVLKNVETVSISNGERNISAESGDKFFLWSGVQSMIPLCTAITVGENTNSEPIETPEPEESKTLVVYFSWSSSGNTERMANVIREHTGADLLEIEPVTPYPTDYNECGNVARIERDNNTRPQIANLLESVTEYDTIFIGYPIWWHTAPMIIGTFLENYDLSGIDIYPFSQSASMDTSQFNNSMAFVRENAGNATVHDGLFVRASNTDAIVEYLLSNGFVN